VFLKYTEAEKKLLEYLRHNDEITLSKFLKTVKINKFRAENILVNLISIGVLKIVFTEKEVFYRLNEPAKV